MPPGPTYGDTPVALYEEPLVLTLNIWQVTSTSSNCFNISIFLAFNNNIFNKLFDSRISVHKTENESIGFLFTDFQLFTQCFNTKSIKNSITNLFNLLPIGRRKISLFKCIYYEQGGTPCLKLCLVCFSNPANATYRGHHWSQETHKISRIV